MVAPFFWGGGWAKGVRFAQGESSAASGQRVRQQRRVRDGGEGITRQRASAAAFCPRERNVEESEDRRLARSNAVRL